MCCCPARQHHPLDQGLDFWRGLLGVISPGGLRPRGFLAVTLLARSCAGEGTNREQPRSCGMSTNKIPNDTPSNAVKDPEDWATGDETMTGAQASYLKTLCQEAGEEFDPSLTKADASKRIDELQEKTGRGKFH
jgi:hypothetical protein